MISKWTALVLWQMSLFHSRKPSFPKEGRPMKDDLWFISEIAQCTQVAFQRWAWRKRYCPHATAIPFTWPGPRDFYLFPTVKEKPERIQLADDNDFFESRQAILSGLDHEELNVVF
jgi:hypothetical protein